MGDGTARGVTRNHRPDHVELSLYRIEVELRPEGTKTVPVEPRLHAKELARPREEHDSDVDELLPLDPRHHPDGGVGERSALGASGILTLRHGVPPRPRRPRVAVRPGGWRGASHTLPGAFAETQRRPGGRRGPRRQLPV